MRIDVIIPDRGDRPQFMENCMRMLHAQTFIKNNNNVLVINTEKSKPKSDKCDITFRYRTVYDAIKTTDLIAFIENDDWYAPTYLEYMAKKWVEAGKPELFGTNYTIYYHLKHKRYFTFRHLQRASAMSTFIKPGLEFQWPEDHDPYTDSWLWMQPNGIQTKVSIEPEYIVCVGMKHGIGKSGGEFHDNFENRFNNDDNGFLQNTLDTDSYKFYSGIDFP
jgi:hypothetical protein